VNSTSTQSAVLPHVADLHDSDLDLLIDKNLFDFGAWCSGTTIGTPAVIACLACGYYEEVDPGCTLDPVAPHIRRVPRYTKDMGMAWKVVEKVRERGGQVAVLFELRLGALIHGRVLSLDARMVAVAALQAIGCIDLAGYIVGPGTR
jgi:hypothetical protein